MSARSLPLVSVVIPCYQHAHLLPRALNSVLRQSWPRLEVLVVDNHSTDGTQAALHAFADPRLRLLQIHNHGVIAASRNLGLREAMGDYIAFLDADDWWQTGKLERSMKLALAGADVVYHDLDIMGEDGRVRPWRRSRARTMPDAAYQDLVRNGCALPNSSVVVRKAALQAIGGLRENVDLVGWEDFDTWLRLARHGCRFARLPGSHGYYWSGVGSTSNPQRTLDNIDAFIAHYISANSEAAIPWWCHYARAVAWRRLGQHARAAASLAAAWRCHPDLYARSRIACRWLLAC